MTELKIDSEEKKNLLDHASRCTFSMGLDDIGSELCQANIVYGLSKIHWMQKELGMEPNATFISGPDETVSRNRVRWQDGFGYGGKVSWGPGNEKLVVLNVMVNACGMFIGGLNSEPDIKSLINNLKELHDQETYIDDIKIDWDLGKSNHFVDIFKVISTSKDIFPEYAFIIHAGAPEIKGDNAKGPGLYYAKSKILEDRYKIINTPIGKLYYLDGNDASEYYEFFQFAREFSKKRREYAANKLFDDHKIISNTMHQTLPSMNEILLGSHDISGAKYFPVTLRSDRPAFIMMPKPSLSNKTLEFLDFESRGNELGALDRLKSANILPHGGGYTFPFLSKVEEVFELNSTRYFVVSLHDSDSRKVIADLHEIQYMYRDEKVIQRTLELDLGEVVARLEPLYVLKV